jgi:hypothetical protein
MPRKKITQTQSAEKIAEELTTQEQTEQPTATQEQADQPTAIQDAVINDASAEAPLTQESNEEDHTETGAVANDSDQPIDGSATPDSSSAPETSADEPTSEAPTPKKTKLPVSQKTRCIIMLDGDTVEILGSFKLPRSSVGRAVIAGCQEFLATIEGELTEDQLKAKLIEKLS